MAEVKKRDLQMVPYHFLVIKEGFNIRSDMGDIELLASSIKENGVKVPLRGYKEKGAEKFVIVDGHRRYQALSLIAKDSSEVMYIPFVLEPQKYNDEQRVIDMFIMNDGKNLTPLEQAEGVRRLQAWGYNDTEISKKIGRSAAYVGKLASLVTAPKKMINLIEKGKISASFAMDIITKGEVDVFLDGFEAGKYEMNGHEMFPDQAKKKAKITKGDVAPTSSWKLFKKFAKNADDKQMEEDKAKFFKFLCRIMNDEVTEESLKRFFK